MKKLVLLCALFMSVTLYAQEEKEPLTQEIPATESNLQLAGELSKYGYANKSALALIQAAQIVMENNFTEEPAQKEGAETPQTEEKQGGFITLDVDKLLADAKDLAGDDANLLALIEKAKQDQTKRSPLTGEKYNYTRVYAHSTDTYTVTFAARETAVVTVVGDGDTDLDLYVYDSNGNLIEKDDDYTDNCIVYWTPKWTGKFLIKVVNRGSVYNQYIIRMR